MNRGIGSYFPFAVIAVAVAAGVVLAATGPGAELGDDQPDPDRWFRAVGQEVGFDYTDRRDHDGIRGDMSNAGVYVADVDADGRSDVLAIGGDRPVLFENTGGAFEATGALADVSGADARVRSALFFDYDRDGWSDLLLLRHNATPIFLENHRGTFEPRSVGLDSRLNVPIGASAADYDRDGCLDLFVIQNGEWDRRRPARLVGNASGMAAGNGNPNVLFEGDCGSFERVEDAGIAGAHWSLATSFVDLTDDGWPDIHVANDFNYDALYVNQRNGSFRRVELADTNRNGMSSEVADVDGDGRLDLFVTNIYWTEEARQEVGTMEYAVRDHQGNNLLLNRGDGEFDDRAAEYGVLEGRWGWAAVMADFDNDDDLDLFHTTRGQFFVRPPYFVDLSKLYDFKQARFFERTSTNRFTPRPALELGFTELDGRGTARLDYNNDGALDLIVANATGQYQLFENRRSRGNSVVLHLVDRRGATAIGARVAVRVNGSSRTYAVTAGADYLSQEPSIVHIGTGTADRIDEIQIVWFDGTERTLTDVAVGQRLVVHQGGEVVRCPFDRRGPPGTQPCPTTGPIDGDRAS